ncbi:MAG: hypothetical protein J1E02_01405 [Coprobacter sp.]|nr:hypothetical protein [Coprobacter sp.]
MNDKTRNTLFCLSALCVLVASALYITQWAAVPYIFAVGAAGIAVCRLTFRYEGNNFRLKRLYRMETFSALLLVAASWFMFKARNEWILLLTVSAVLQLYTAILIPRLSEKDTHR